MKETLEKNGRVFAYNKHINQSKKALECHALDWNYFLHIFPHWEDIPRSLLHVLAVKINQNWGKHPPQSRANAIIDIWATQMTTPQRHSLSALTDPCLHQRDINADKLWSWNRCASQSAGAMNAVILESSASAPNALWKVQLGRNKGNLCLVKIKWDLLYPADTIGNHHRKTSERKNHHLTFREGKYPQIQLLSTRMCLGSHSSHRSPAVPGLQTHWPDLRSQSPWTEPRGLQSHLWQVPPGIRGFPW